MTPTRKQKKTWRRRVSRARWSRNALRSVGYHVTGWRFIAIETLFTIDPPWLRGAS